MQRWLLIIGLAVNMLSCFLQMLGLVLKLPLLLVIGLCVTMLNIFLSVLALVTRAEDTLSDMMTRMHIGTPRARDVTPVARERTLGPRYR
uniref:ORFX n=1 Tax=Maize chlorotic dwarf virus TaxID=51354 RepID=A0A5B7LFG5_9SECO|nr:ORFX [Maize chlorotic dwarf virus]